MVISALSLCSFSSNGTGDAFGLLLKTNTDNVWNSKDAETVQKSLDWLTARSGEGNKPATEAVFNLAQNHHDPKIHDEALGFLKTNFASNPRTIRLVAAEAWNSKDAIKFGEHLDWLKARAGEGNQQAIEAIFNLAQNKHDPKIHEQLLRVLMTEYASDTRTMKQVVHEAWNSKDAAKVEESITWIKARDGEGNAQAHRELLKIAQHHPNPDVRKSTLDYLNK